MAKALWEQQKSKDIFRSSVERFGVYLWSNHYNDCQVYRMTSLTPENINVRKIALWACSIIGFIFIFLLATKAAISLYFFDARNPIAIILFLMLFTGIMHTIIKELRIPAIVLSVVSIVALLLLLFGF